MSLYFVDSPSMTRNVKNQKLDKKTFSKDKMGVESKSVGQEYEQSTLDQNILYFLLYFIINTQKYDSIDQIYIIRCNENKYQKKG